jgi:dihydrolipoamide dehydrogenase
MPMRTLTDSPTPSPAATLTLERPAAPTAGAAAAETAGQISIEPRPQREASPEGVFDVAVIGAGPGGYVAAIRAAQLGLRTAVIEQTYMGGTCLNVGCIPTKAMLSSVEALSTARRGKEFGFTAGDVQPDYPAMVERRDKIVQQLRMGVQSLMKSNGIATFNGHGRLTGPGEVEVAGQEGPQPVRARNVILATGSVPASPPIPGADLEGVVNSDQLLQLKSIPQRMAVVGAGAVGLEWGDIFAELGTKITVFEMVEQILPPADAEVAAELTRDMKRRGFDIHTSAMVNGFERRGDALAVKFSTPAGAEQELVVDIVLVATGRWPYTEGLGLDSVGLTLDRRALLVNDRLQTRAPGIYAIGDLVPGLQLAHVASREGEVAVETIAGKEAHMDYGAIPFGVYTHPEVAWVGLTEEEAAKEHPELKIGRFPFRILGRALAAGHREGFVKVIAEPRYGEILGVHMIGYHVTDLIAEAVLAMSLESTVDEIIHAIHAHPTMPEALAEASLDVWDRAIHKA